MPHCRRIVREPTTTLAWLLLLVTTSPRTLAAQAFAERFAACQRLVDQQRWDAAFTSLEELAHEAQGTERDQVAVACTRVGQGASASRQPDLALRAFERALSLRRATHGDADHWDVALCLNNVAFCLQEQGRPQEALPRFTAVVAMQRRLASGDDEPELARGLNNLGGCLQTLGRWQEALVAHEEALAMRQRLHGDEDHADVARSLNNTAACLHLLGRPADALARFEQTLAMLQRLWGDADQPAVARCRVNIGTCLQAIGRAQDALPQFEAALAMWRRLAGGKDHPAVAATSSSVAGCRRTLGDLQGARALLEAALAMSVALAGGRDHPDVAMHQGALATCLVDLGRAKAALPLLEAALAMQQRLFGAEDLPDRATTLASAAVCLQRLGRPEQALPLLEAALRMHERMHAGVDHPDVAMALGLLAGCLTELGRMEDGLRRFEAALGMQRRLFPEQDHPAVAEGLNNVAHCLDHLGRSREALSHYEEALAMRQRLSKGDHPDVALAFNNLAACLQGAGRVEDALAAFTAAHEMWRRLFGGDDHPHVARGLANVAQCLQRSGRVEEALVGHREALAMRRRLFAGDEHPEVVISLDNLAACLQQAGRVEEARDLAAAGARAAEQLWQQSRSLSGAMRRSYFDELKRTGIFERLQRLEAQLGAPAAALHAAERSRARELLDLLGQRGRDPVDELVRRATLAGDAATVDRVTAMLAEFESAQAECGAILHALAAAPDPHITIEARAARLAALRTRCREVHDRRDQLANQLARSTADVAEFGEVAMTPAIQSGLQADELLLEFTISTHGSLLFVVPHEGAIQAHALPHAAAAITTHLPTLMSALSRGQLAAARGRDPGRPATTPTAAGEANRALFAALFPTEVWQRIRGCRRVQIAPHRELHRLPFEVLATGGADGATQHWIDSGPRIAYVPSGSVMHWLRQRQRGASQDRAQLALLAVGDPAGGGATAGAPADRSPAVGAGRRAGDIERLRSLPPLRGARAEVEGIAALFGASEGTPVRTLLGTDATERAVFELAKDAGILHFACHGIAEEFAGQSFSMLVLSDPGSGPPTNDGLLLLDDLRQHWQGRLGSCNLVVLSACRTQVGPQHRDEAPQALPLGFLCAGASAVIGSLWAVDDDSTRELMTDFYRRLLLDPGDRLGAFTAARRALRAARPDPFHWAPFLFVGCPD